MLNFEKVSYTYIYLFFIFLCQNYFFLSVTRIFDRIFTSIRKYTEKMLRFIFSMERYTRRNGKWVARCTHRQQGERSLKRFSLCKLNCIVTRCLSCSSYCVRILHHFDDRNCSLSIIKNNFHLSRHRAAYFSIINTCLYSDRKFSRNFTELQNPLNFTFSRCNYYLNYLHIFILSIHYIYFLIFDQVILFL